MDASDELSMLRTEIARRKKASLCLEGDHLCRKID